MSGMSVICTAYFIEVYRMRCDNDFYIHSNEAAASPRYLKLLWLHSTRDTYDIKTQVAVFYTFAAGTEFLGGYSTN